MVAASSVHSTHTFLTPRRYTSSLAQGLKASPRRWLISFTSTAQTASSSQSYLPRPCRSAWTPWPFTITSGRPSGLLCQKRVQNETFGNCNQGTLLYLLYVWKDDKDVHNQLLFLFCAAPRVAVYKWMSGQSTCSLFDLYMVEVLFCTWSLWHFYWLSSCYLKYIFSLASSRTAELSFLIGRCFVFLL